MKHVSSKLQARNCRPGITYSCNICKCDLTVATPSKKQGPKDTKQEKSIPHRCSRLVKLVSEVMCGLAASQRTQLCLLMWPKRWESHHQTILFSSQYQENTDTHLSRVHKIAAFYLYCLQGVHKLILEYNIYTQLNVACVVPIFD
jgi:hypothetical protein